MLSHQRANLADQPINNNRRKLIYVSRPLVMKQTFDRHMSKMFDQPSQSGLLTSGLFKILEFLQAFPFFPSTSPFFLSFFFLLFFFFLALVPFIARPKISTENPVPRSFFSPKRNGNACYAGVCNPIQSYFLPPGKGGGEIRWPLPLYNFRAAHDTATKITRNSVLSIFNNKAQLMCMMSRLRHIKFVSRTKISSSYLKTLNNPSGLSCSQNALSF